jgi:hypothetical protein
VSLSSQTFHSVIWQKDGLSTVPTFQYLLRQHHFRPLPSISIICLYQPQPKIDIQITGVTQVKKLILLPSMVLFGYLMYVYFIVVSLTFLSPYRVHSSRHCFKPSFLNFHELSTYYNIMKIYSKQFLGYAMNDECGWYIGTGPLPCQLSG